MARILVVEPMKPVAQALRKHLEGAGYEVDVVEPAGGAAAFDAGTHEVAVVAAEPDGSALVKTVKAASPSTPVVLTFPPETDDADARAVEAGADGLLVGPLKKPTVVSCVKAMSRVRSLMRQIEELEKRLAGAPNHAVEADFGAMVDAPPPPPPEPEKKGRPRSHDEQYDFEFFKKLLLMEVKRSKRYRYPISLAVVAVDAWREKAGELDGKGRAKLLGELLAVITKAVRDIDLPLLYAEEKFLVFMPHTPGDGAMTVARRLVDRVRSHESDVRVTASVGVASFDGEGTISFGTLIKSATDALRKAQLDGGDRPERAGGAEKKKDRVVMG